jgi:uracil-DNA glycosylase family 4
MLKPESCSPCSLVNISDGWCLSEGEGTSGVVILGEAAGYNEYIDNLPFRPHAQAGSKLEEAFRLVSKDLGQPISRNQFLLYNVVNCHPPGDKLSGASYEASAIECCSKNVDRVLNNFHTNKIKTILALGNIPLKFFTGVSGVAEEKQSISHLRGFVFESKYGKVVPSYHPSYIRRGNGHLTPMLVEDMKKALGVARGTYTSYMSHREYVPPIYQTSPGLDEAWSFYYRVKDAERGFLSYDIETPQTGNIDEDERDDLESADIVLVQFSIAKHTGIAMPFNLDYLPVIQALFRLPNVKGNHNCWNFDNPRLKAKGIDVGKTHDTMWMFKHWHPRLPRGLQSVVSLLGFPFPWKHLYSTQLQWYGCADVDAVQWIVHDLPKLMKARGVWRGYVEHVYSIHPIFERATETGIPVSEEKRVSVKEDFTERREKEHVELQKLIPDAIRNIRPKRKDKETGEVDYGYKREPKIIGEEFERYKRISKELLGKGKSIVSFGEYLYRKHNLAYAEFENRDDVTGQVSAVERWCIVEDFKASSTQLIRYLKWKQERLAEEIEKLEKERQDKFGGRNPELTEKINELRELREDYEVPISLKTKKETTSHKELEEMYFNTGDPVLEMVSKIRSYDTNLNNFIPNWEPSKKDGAVHPSYGYTAPSGQINSWKPNSQNVSKHTEFGQEFRGMIEAPPGYCFVEADKKSFHVATMGYCSNDKDYIRFSQIDPHSILGSYIDPNVIGGSISLKWSDAEIKEAAKEFKKRCKGHKAKDPQHNIDVRQELAKPTVLGNQLELGEVKLQRQNRRFITYTYKSQRIRAKANGLSAEELQDICKNLFPKEEVYKKFIKEKAFLDKFLVNEYGRIQYFHDVYSFTFSKKTGKWIRRDGEGARHPIAFRVQSTAFGMITDELVECEREGLCEEHNFLVTIHDSLMFMPEIGKRDKLIEELIRIMNQPAKRLLNDSTRDTGGLVVGVEIESGRNWKRYDEKANKEGMQEVKL